MIKSNGGKEYNLLLPSVVLTLNAIYDNILLAIQQVSAWTKLHMHELLNCCSAMIADHQ